MSVKNIPDIVYYIYHLTNACVPFILKCNTLLLYGFKDELIHLIPNMSISVLCNITEYYVYIYTS